MAGGSAQRRGKGRKLEGVANVARVAGIRHLGRLRVPLDEGVREES